VGRGYWRAGSRGRSPHRKCKLYHYRHFGCVL